LVSKVDKENKPVTQVHHVLPEICCAILIDCTVLIVELNDGSNDYLDYIITEYRY
jgi:hypothetical protein